MGESHGGVMRMYSWSVSATEWIEGSNYQYIEVWKCGNQGRGSEISEVCEGGRERVCRVRTEEGRISRPLTGDKASPPLHHHLPSPTP